MFTPNIARFALKLNDLHIELMATPENEDLELAIDNATAELMAHIDEYAAESGADRELDYDPERMFERAVNWADENNTPF